MPCPVTEGMKIRAQWVSFLRTGSTAGVREVIRSSWLRCREKGLKPTERRSCKDGSVPAELDGAMRRRLRQLVVSRYHDIESRFAFSPFALIFAGADGRLCSLYGSEDVIDQFDVLCVREGASCEEQVAGTNAPYLALMEKKPVTVLAEEHFFEDFHWAKCFAVPIFDYQKNLAGSLGLTTTRACPSKIETLIEYFCWLAHSLSLELFIEERLRRFEIQDFYFRSTFELADQALALVDSEGAILDLNLSGRRLLSASPPPSTFGNLAKWMQFPKTPGSFAAYAGKTHWVQLRSSEIQNGRFAMEVVPLLGQVGDQTVYLVRFLPEETRFFTIAGSNRFEGYAFARIVAKAPQSVRLLDLAKRAAGNASSILLEGETGTGKELLAQAIHHASSYKNGAFVAVNCAAIPQELVESELFGYDRGAYTGAKKEGAAGKFELANGGTIFLDEIQAMSMAAQMKLLRVLEERAVTRISGLNPIPLDFRIITASSESLRRLTEAGDFLEALFYRLNVVNFTIPPLRERKEDIPPMVETFIREMNVKFGRAIQGLTSAAMDLFMRYAWPGNVRELRNCIEYAFNFCDKDVISVEDLGQKLLEFKHNERKMEKTIEGITKDLIVEALKTQPTVTGVADALGISTSTLYRKMKRFNLSK